jgi:hypothetical protein
MTQFRAKLTKIAIGAVVLGAVLVAQNLRVPPTSTGGGAGVWGAITGTVTAQTDLITYITTQLATKVSNLSGTVGAVYWDGDSLAYVSGDPGNCVHVDGSSGACGSGGGSGASMFTQLGDGFGTRISGTVLTVCANCSSTVKSILNGYEFVAPSTVTISAGTSTGYVYVYVTPAGVLTAGHNTANTIGCSNCTPATGITDFPADSLRLFRWNITSGTWDTGGFEDRRSGLVKYLLTNGGGLSITHTATGQQAGVDRALVPYKFSASSLPANCAAGGLQTNDLFRLTTNDAVYICTGTALVALGGGGGGMADPGGDGIIKRTALNVTAPAVAGTDYLAPTSLLNAMNLQWNSKNTVQDVGVPCPAASGSFWTNVDSGVSINSDTTETSVLHPNGCSLQSGSSNGSVIHVYTGTRLSAPYYANGGGTWEMSWELGWDQLSGTHTSGEWLIGPASKGTGVTVSEGLAMRKGNASSAWSVCYASAASELCAIDTIAWDNGNIHTVTFRRVSNTKWELQYDSDIWTVCTDNCGSGNKYIVNRSYSTARIDPYWYTATQENQSKRFRYKSFRWTY